MSLRVLFFGSTAAIVGKREIALAYDSENTASQIFDRLILEFPRLANHHLHVSVNQQYATGEEIVKDGDELAVFTAVSGG